MANVPLSQAVWGIYDAITFQPVFDYDSFRSFKITDTSKVSDFPVEEGAFATYNKVSKAYRTEIELAVSDQPYRRTAFLTQLMSVRKSLDLMHIVTQDYIYLNATLESYITSRVTKGGVGQVVAHLSFIEVRQVAAQYGVAKVRSAGAAKVANSGNVSPVGPQTAAMLQFLQRSAGNPTNKDWTLPTLSLRQFNYGFLGAQGVLPPTGLSAVLQIAVPSTPSASTTPANP